MAAPTESVAATQLLSGGACLVSRRPVFTEDSKYLLVSVGHHIRVYSVATGRCVQNLVGHTNFVSAVASNPHNRLQAISCSLDGTVRYWDLIDGTLLKTFTFAWPIHNMLVHEMFSTNHFYLSIEARTDTIDEDNISFQLVRISPDSDSEETILSKLTGGPHKNVAVSGSGDFLAGISGSKVTVYFFSGSRTYVSLSAGSHPLTCLACHPTKSIIAVGNEMGHITTLMNFSGHHRDSVSNLEHWHAHRVEDLCFSAEGTFLYSVGHECVLVDWNLEKGTKDFLPRLGAPINHVNCSSANDLKAVCLLDNAILILAKNKIQHTIQGISRSRLYFSTTYMPCGILLDPRTNALVKNGRKGHLQFYSIDEDKSIYNVDITGENYVSGSSLEDILKYTDVVKAAFSTKGDWMATVEERRSTDNSELQSRLKFWIFDEQQQRFLLNTTVEAPHEEEVFILKFQPSKLNTKKANPMVATVSHDNKFKIWTYGENLSSYKKSKCWNCDCVGFYKDMAPSDATFSADGSLLMVSFKQTITLWEPATNALRKTLCHTLSNLPIRCLESGRGQSSHLLVSSTADRVTVWNLLSCQVAWSVPVCCQLLIPDPYSELMACIDASNNLFVFHPADPKPVFTMKDLDKKVVDGLFVPRSRRNNTEGAVLPWQKHSRLYLVTEDEDLVAIVTREEAEVQSSKERLQNNLEENLPLTPFAEFVQRQSAATKKPKSEQLSKYVGDSSLVKEMMLTPPHILPSVRALRSGFFHSLLHPADNKRDSEGDESDSEEDEEREEKSDNSGSEMEIMQDDAKPSEPAASIPQKTQIIETELSQLAERSREELSFLQTVFTKLGVDS